MRRFGHSKIRLLGAIALLAIIAAVAVAIALRVARPLVSITEPVEGPVVQAFYATGTITPDREYPIKSNVAGIIVDVRADKGQRVRKGDVLAIVKNDELPLKLEQARAELAEKRQRADEKTSPVLRELETRLTAFTDLLDIARREARRQEGLLDQGGGSQSDFDKALERLKSVWSDLESTKALRATKKLELEKEATIAQAALDIAQWNYDQQTIVSPIDGVVLDRPVSAGTRLAINDHVMQVADVDSARLVMRAQVDEEDRVKLREAQRVNVTLYSFPGKPFVGAVAKIYPQADAERRTFEVDVKLDTPDPGLAPGMTGELAFEVAHKDRAMVIPAQALQAGIVWVVRNHRLARADPAIGLKSVERVEVLSGLSSGDTVLITPIGTLAEGQAVRTQYVDPRTAALLNRPTEKQDAFKAGVPARVLHGITGGTPVPRRCAGSSPSATSCRTSANRWCASPASRSL
jgi:HlyD family secretion protein